MEYKDHVPDNPHAHATPTLFCEALPNSETTLKTVKYLDDFTDKSGFFLFICRLGIYLK
jgi:hypothetical protein